jgi:hypothetical protein
MLISFSPSGLVTILPQEVSSLLPPKRLLKKRKKEEKLRERVRMERK